MKYKVLLGSICLCLFFACKKEKKAPDPDTSKLYPINFDVSGFSQTQTPISSDKAKGSLSTLATTTPATDTLPYQTMYYFLYAFDTYNPTKLVSVRQVNIGDPNFNHISDNVPAGKYRAYFGAGSKDLSVSLNSFFNSFFYYGLNFGPVLWSDTFYKMVPINVTPSGINQNVTLDRITGILDVVIKDPIPVGTSKVTVSFADSTSYFLMPTKGTHGFDTRLIETISNITAADVGKTNHSISIYTMQNITPFDVTLKYYGTNLTVPLATKVVKNVVCKTNTKTILSGNLFSPGNTGFSIKTDLAWNTPISINF